MGSLPKAVGESPAQLPGMERLSRRSKLIAIKLCAVSEMHAKVRRAHKVVAKIWRTPARLRSCFDFIKIEFISVVLNAFSAMFVRLFRHIARYAPRQTGKYASKIQFKPTVDKIKTASNCIG